MGEEGLEALRREESRVERLLSDGKMSLVKQDELRYDIHKSDVGNKCLAEHHSWLPDGCSRIFRIICVWPFGLLDYGSASLRRSI